MRFTNINGVNIHFDVLGPADGLPVVFSNSLGTDFRIWDDLIEAIKSDIAADVGNQRRLRFIRYDKRGHGLSDAPAPPYSMDEHADDLIGLLDHLEIDKALIIGLSVGGMIAQSVAARIPARITAIVLSNTAHVIGTRQVWNDRIGAVADNGIKSISDGIIERWFSPEFQLAEPSKLAICRNMLERTTMDGYIGTGAAIRDCDLTATTRQISVPVLLIAGSKDGSTPPDLMASTHSLIANSRFKIVEGSGHLPCIEQPVETARLILDFMKDNSLV